MILFIVPTFKCGGTENYLIALINEKICKNEIVSLLILGSYDHSIVDKLNKRCNVLFFYNFLSNNTFLKYIYKWIFKLHYMFSPIFSLNKKITLKETSDITHIHAVDSECIDVAIKISLFTKSIITAGLYHSKEYSWKKSSLYRSYQLKRLYSIPIENIYFANSDMYTLYCNKFITNYSEKNSFSNIFNVGFDLNSFRNNFSFSCTDNTVAVIGRLVNFKSYIRNIILIWRKINNNFHNTKLFIIGDGPERSSLIKIASGLKNVHFLGTLDFNELSSMLSSVKLVITSGTSVYLTSSCGVPTIMGVESENLSVCYGLFSDFKGNSHNRARVNHYHDLYECVKNILKLDPTSNEYQKIAFAHKSKSNQYSISNTNLSFNIYQKNSRYVKLKPPSTYENILRIIELFLNKINLLSSIRKRYF